MIYERLAAEVETPRGRIRDWTARWDALTPVLSTNGNVRDRLDAFAASKRISVDALSALDARIAIRRGGSSWLAFAGRSDAGAVTAIKYRPLGGGSHASEAEKPSVWVRPIVAGKRDSLRERRMKVRDRLFSEGQIVNVVKNEQGNLEALTHCPERRPSRLHLHSDPTISHLLLTPGAVGEQSAPAGAAGENLHLLPAPFPIREQGVGADAPPSDFDRETVA
jgi:hypothetical protein